MVPTRSGEAEEVAGMDGERSAAAAAAARSGTSRSHSEAERKRRQRINAHLATLRGLLPPSASQMDKAALLGEVVRRVRELRGGAAAGVAVPGESDEVGVEEEYWDAGERARRVRAWVCCADRPGLMSELGRAVRSASSRAVRAEIATVAGRTRSVLELDVGPTAGATSRPALQAALRAVLLSREELLAVESYKRQHFSALISKV